jgi:hypothetical protein
MAGRGPQTFKKRQKEQERKDRQDQKRARRLQRKDGAGQPEGAGQADLPVDPEPPNEA